MIHIDQYRFGSAFNVDASFIFNGTDEYLNKSGTTWDAALTFGNDITISLWVRSTASTAPQDYLMAMRYDGSNYFMIYESSTLLAMIFADAGSTFTVAGGGVPTLPNDGNWYHFLFVKKTGTNPVTIYRNGILAYTSSSTSVQVNANTLSSEINIGRHPTAGRYFKGNICQYALWNNDQSSNIATIYGGGTPADLTSLSPDLWWEMNQDDTLNAVGGVLDSSGNAVHISGNNMDATNIDTVNFPP